MVDRVPEASAEMMVSRVRVARLHGVWARRGLRKRGFSYCPRTGPTRGASELTGARRALQSRSKD
jgi:hypothetical protein